MNAATLIKIRRILGKENAYIESFNGSLSQRVPERALVRDDGTCAAGLSRPGGSSTTPSGRTAPWDDLTPEEYAKKMIKPEIPPCGRETALRGEDLDEDRREANP